MLLVILGTLSLSFLWFTCWLLKSSYFANITFNLFTSKNRSYRSRPDHVSLPRRADSGVRSRGRDPTILELLQSRLEEKEHKGVFIG